MEETGCEIICGAPMTLAVKGQMMIMMMMLMTKDLIEKNIGSNTSLRLRRTLLAMWMYKCYTIYLFLTKSLCMKGGYLQVTSHACSFQQISIS